jgi:hypothetical protein
MVERFQQMIEDLGVGRGAHHARPVRQPRTPACRAGCHATIDEAWQPLLQTQPFPGIVANAAAAPTSAGRIDH